MLSQGSMDRELRCTVVLEGSDRAVRMVSGRLPQSVIPPAMRQRRLADDALRMLEVEQFIQLSRRYLLG